LRIANIGTDCERRQPWPFFHEEGVWKRRLPF
jgi:hypothetical protein